jgi:hypothetical protein
VPARPVTVFYHADCPDGFGAAYAAWLRFGAGARYRAMHHGQPWKMAEIAGHEVFILDFSFVPDVLEAIAGLAGPVVQIDHHASARQPWADRLGKSPDGAEIFRHPALPLTVIFDLGKSGVHLAWEHFHPDRPVPLVLRHVEDVDLGASHYRARARSPAPYACCRIILKLGTISCARRTRPMRRATRPCWQKAKQSSAFSRPRSQGWRKGAWSCPPACAASQ